MKHICSQNWVLISACTGPKIWCLSNMSIKWKAYNNIHWTSLFGNRALVILVIFICIIFPLTFLTKLRLLQVITIFVSPPNVDENSFEIGIQVIWGNTNVRLVGEVGEGGWQTFSFYLFCWQPDPDTALAEFMSYMITTPVTHVVNCTLV